MIRSLVCLALFLLGLRAPLAAQEARAPWSEEIVETFARLPVQDGGRVKPLDTYAAFRLLNFNGKRSFETPAGEKLGPTSWLLDCFFHPELARTYRMFLVRDADVLARTGLRIEGRRKTDRYSYDELKPAKDKLFSEASRVEAIDPKKRGREDAQLYALAIAMRDFEYLTHALEFTRVKLATSASPVLAGFFEGRDVNGVSDFLVRVPALQSELEQKLSALPDEAARGSEHDALAAVSEALSDAVQISSAFGNAAKALDIFPPPREQETWFDVSGATEHYFAAHDETLRGLIASWEALEAKKGDRAAFAAELEGLRTKLVGATQARGLDEYRHVEREVAFYRTDYFTKALVFFLLGFVVLCVTWLAPKLAFLEKGIWGLCLLATALVVWGVVQRCIIRERPPVSTLYETILFITGCGSIVLLAAEWIQRGRIALSLTPVFGAAGMFLAMKYELKEAATANDTMPSLVAVLDTNFWLATHVTTITLGYAAGLVAAALGNVWMIAKMIGLKRSSKDFYRAITRMTYGVVCFGLIFSIVGTILGGIWANYSWGRFWGWDPKENGALLICIGQLLILHLRLGGYIKEHGIAALAALNGMVVAFSWWHVNHLGVGLHSYGFTEGVIRALYVYYAIALAVVLASFIWRAAAKQAEAGPSGTSASLGA